MNATTADGFKNTAGLIKNELHLSLITCRLNERLLVIRFGRSVLYVNKRMNHFGFLCLLSSSQRSSTRVLGELQTLDK